MFFSLIVKKKYIGLLILLSFFTILLFLSYRSITLPSHSDDLVFKVVVDAGHGSIDTGASYGQIYEKDINLKIALMLADELKKVNIIPVLTRKEDKLYHDSRREDIRYRPRVTKDNNADLFISIHANKFPSSQPQGSQIFYKPGSEKSKELAQKIKAELVKLRTANDRSIKSGDFYVLNNSPCPAILIEAGFLSNPTDRKKLTDPVYQQALAEAICRGSVNYLQENLGEINQKEEQQQNTMYIDQEKENYLYYLGRDENKVYYLKNKLTIPADTSSHTTKELLVTLQKLKSAPAGYYSPLPAGTKIKSLKVTKNKAVVNFSRELKENFQGGAAREYKTIQAIARTLFSLPDIDEVEILIDGQKHDTIGGHVILKTMYRKKTSIW